MTPTSENYENVKLPANLEVNIDNIKRIMNNSSDLLVNKFEISGHKSALLCCEGMVSTSTITELILHPMMRINLEEYSLPSDAFNVIQNKILLGIDRVFPTEYGPLIRLIMSGFALILVDGIATGAAFGVQGYERRSVQEPSGETNIRGSHEGFVETIRINVTMLRKRMKSPTLKFEMFQVGSRSKTDVCLAYLTDKVPQKMVDEIKRRLGKIKLETVLGTGYIEPFLEGKVLSMFHSVGTTERPDAVCGKLLEGRVALIVDGTPFVITMPYLFIENFQTLDDYNLRPFYATFIRWVKYFAFAITVLLPGVYTAVATFHPEIFNDKLLINLAAAEQNAPLPLAFEAFLMLIMYEIIREAGLRLPKAVGGGVSIVGGLIIGDAAVSSGLISTPLLIAIALSVTASFVIPNLNQSTTILRLIFVICGGIWGLYGVSIMIAILLFNICSLENFGIPMTAPISPLTLKSMRDVAIRLGFKKMQSGDVTVEKLRGANVDENI